MLHAILALLATAGAPLQRDIDYAILDSVLATHDARLFVKLHDTVFDTGDKVDLLNVLLSWILVDNETTQRCVLDRIVWYGDAAQLAVNPLITIATNPRSRNRRLAIICLGKLGPAASQAIPDLASCLDEQGDRAFEIRPSACVALYQIEKQRGRIIPTLIAGLRSDEAVDQVAALEAIDVIGTAIKESVWSDIERLSESKNVFVRRAAILMLPRFAGDGRAPGLLADSLVQVLKRQDALDSPARRDRPLEDIAVAYNELRTDRMTIIAALVSLRAGAVPILVELLQPRHDVGTRFLALEIIAALGQDGKAATDEVRKMVADPNAILRVRADKTLKALAGE